MRTQIQLLLGIIMLLFTGNIALAQNYEWAKQVGGNHDDQSNSIAVDASGNIFITGYFNGTADFDPGTKVSNLTSLGGKDIFIAKYSSNGIYQWAFNIGGSSSDEGQGIALDDQGNIYVTGYFTGIDIDFNPETKYNYLTSAGNSKDIFIAKYTNNGQLLWANAIGGTSSDVGYDIDIDSDGHIYVTGKFNGNNIDFDPSTGTAFQSSNGQTEDIFVAKYNQNGEHQWSFGMGGVYHEYGNAIELDASNNVYVTGRFFGESIDFDPSNKTNYLSSSNLSADFFLVKYNSNGEYQWGFGIGGITVFDNGHDLASDGNGNIFVTGSFGGVNVDFDPSADNAYLSSVGYSDMFIAKYNKDGQYLWAGNAGASMRYSYGLGLDTDQAGNVFATGYFTGNVDFDFGIGENYLSSTSEESNKPDLFFLKYSNDGNHQWSYSLGQGNTDQGRSIVIDGSNDICLTGIFQGVVDFDPSEDVSHLNVDIGNDIFIAKYNNQNIYKLKSLLSAGSTLKDIGNSIITDIQGNTYISGSFEGTIDFDPGPGQILLTSNGENDIFIAKFNDKEELVWAQSIGGNHWDDAYDITLDKSGNVYITGRFFSSQVDFDPGINTANLTNKGLGDIFLAKYSNNGHYEWALSIGGTQLDIAYGLVTDQNENVYITGKFEGINVDFDPGIGVTHLTSNGGSDIFIAKYTKDGNFVWVNKIGGIENDIGQKISIDGSNNIYVTGLFQQTVDFDPGLGKADLISVGGYDIFVAKFNQEGVYSWAFNIGSNIDEENSSITTDQIGNVYVTGSFKNTTDFDPSGLYNLVSYGELDAFIAKYNTQGRFEWVNRLGSIGDDEGKDIVVDGGGNIYVTGYFSGAIDFDPNPSKSTIFNTSGNNDIFIIRYNSGGTYQWAYTSGGINNDQGLGITVNGIGNGYVQTTGYFSGTNIDFDPGIDSKILSSSGSTDIFLSKIRVAACATPYTQPTGLVFSSPTETNLSIQSLTPPVSTADGYIIKINTSDSFTSPNNGTLPSANPVYSSGEQVVYADEGLPTFPFSITGLNGNTTYYLKVYAFNKCGNTYLFETIGLIGNTTTDRVAQSINFNALLTKTYGDENFALSASSTSGLSVTYQSSNPAVATIVNNEVTIVGAGSTTITASQTGNNTYYPATNTQQTLVVNKASQIINFDALSEKLFDDSDFSLEATASSGLGVTYSSSNPAVATVSAGVVTIVGTGATIITANQTGDDNYLPASTVNQILTVNKASQIINFNAISAKTYGDAHFNVQATTTSGLGITYTIADPTIATINGNQVTILKAGTTTITASQAGNSNYNTATPVTQPLVINKKDQSITFDLGIHAKKSVSSDPFVLTASASSGLPISFASSDSSIVNVTENVATITGSGTTTIIASQAGNINFNPAPPVSRTIEVTIGRPTELKTSIVGRHTIQLSWKIALSQTQETRVERSAEKPDNFKVVTQVNARRYSDSSLSIRPRVTYYYRVIAVGAGSETSAPSDTVGVKVPKEEVVTQNKEQLQKSIKVSPNPSHQGVFHIQAPSHILKNAKIILTNAQGKVLVAPPKTFPKINLSNHPSGAYMLKIITNKGQIITKQLIKN